MTEMLKNDILPAFSTIKLDEMEHVSFMERTERKYIMSVHRLPRILAESKTEYRVLEIDNSCIFPYSNTYLDTGSLLFYKQHLTGKYARHKVRFRTYDHSGITYLEVKRRTNRNRTEKWRIEHPPTGDLRISNRAIDFINEHLKEEQLNLLPVLFNSFKRMTLVGKNSIERVTIDFDIIFSNMALLEIRLPYLAIIEIKRKELSVDSPLGIILKQNMIHPGGFSKYCMGYAMVNTTRPNRLKSRFLALNKLQNEYIDATGIA